MTARSKENQCVECGNKTPNRNLICDRCRPLYEDEKDDKIFN